MTDLILQIGASKLGISVGLAGVAWVVQRRFDRPQVSHLLWLLVLGTLVVPSVVSIPIPGLSGIETVPAARFSTVGTANGTMSLSLLTLFFVEYGKAGLAWLWLLGTACVLSWSLLRTLRFHHGATVASERGSPELQHLASELARKLGLASVPTIYTTRAHLSPMVWWIGGTPRVLIPADLIEDMDHEELRWILAHELAHVRRRDHLIRWIEWLTCCVFWWNPVAWLARRQLRAAEEFCCDALVLAAFGSSPRSYASSLVSVIDFLSTPPTLRAPAFASEADSGGHTRLIERRLKMIISNNSIPTMPRWVRAARMAAVLVLPLGLIYCGPSASVVNPESSALEMSVREHELREGDLPVHSVSCVPKALALRIRRHVEDEAFRLDDEQVPHVGSGFALGEDRHFRDFAQPGERTDPLLAGNYTAVVPGSSECP